MSELRRGWWKDVERFGSIKGARSVTHPITERGFYGPDGWRDPHGGEFYVLDGEQMQHVRDFIDYVERFCCCERGLHEGRRYDKHDLLNRGTPPEPEWLPVGVAPDREGVWEREGPGGANKDLRVTSWGPRGLAMHGYKTVWPVLELDHSKFRYRRIGDL